MVIEKGDVFVVMRGRVKPPTPQRTGSLMEAMSMFGESWKIAEEQQEPQYDNSWGGLVWEAMEVCGPMVAAKCIFGYGDKKGMVGRAMPMNTSGMELMVVTREFAAALMGAHAPPQPKPDTGCESGFVVPIWKPMGPTS